MPNDNTPPKQHALYRLFDAGGALLYVGITLDPGQRWKKHREEKPWWTEVASITLEQHANRNAVLDAERTAILTEHPAYNIVHNRKTTKGDTVSSPQLDRLNPFQVGDWVALGLKDGRCPVGEIAAYDDTWISVRLKEFLMGSLTNQIVAARWEDIERAELAYPENSYTEHGSKRMDDEHLGEFQVGWKRTHLGESKDPVETAIGEYRAEQQQARRQ